MKNSKDTLNHCLYFTANALARNITRMAEEEFRITGLSPSHAFVMMLVHDNPGASLSEIAKHLQIAPSTATRFIDQLEKKKFVTRSVEGKNSFLHPTEKGIELYKQIKEAWKNLYDRYNEVLTKDFAGSVANDLQKANSLLIEE